MSITKAAIALLLLLAAALDAGAQDVAGRSPTVVWASCEAEALGSSTDTGPITLHEVAVRARPALWFSRDEPLLDLDGPLPREWPRGGTTEPSPEDLVYYRLTKIKSTSSDDALVSAFQARLTPARQRWISPTSANPEAIADVPLDTNLLRRLKEVVIRYLFYYPNELGSHSHAHDLESVELRVVIERADEHGDPRAAQTPCWQIRVAALFGAAHGLGLYTNVLDLDSVMRDRLDEAALVVESTSRRSPSVPGSVPPLAPPSGASLVDGRQRFNRTDPFWPLIVLVEEGKHASAPDRNGDGAFTPNYDVNRFSADAWGARDTMRSRQLSPVFRSDTFKRRIPEIAVDSAGRLRYAQLDDLWAAQMFDRHVRYEYRLRRPTEDADICGDPWSSREDRGVAMTQYAGELMARQKEGHPDRLLRGKAFCDDAVVHGDVNVTDVLRRMQFGGAYNGFTHWWERISASARFDGGAGLVVTLPVAWQVPGLGGWTVARVSQPFGGTAARKSVDVAYMPSGARFSDWYVATGFDYGRYVSGATVDDGVRMAVEAGVKIRFPLPDLGTFLGGRVGIRANGTQLSRQRLVFEVGAGIW